MDFETSTKKCDCCGLWLSLSEFYKNKSKSSGIQNRCKDCMKDYKIKLSQGLIEKQEIIKKEFYYIPDIFLVGFGRTQAFQNCCLNCNEPFFCMDHIRRHDDLYCENCNIDDESKVSEKNISKINYIGNVVGWLAKTENPVRRRSSKNYKKVYIRDKYTCQYCGYNLKDATVFLPLHIDHIKPFSAHGGNAESNLVVACQECNLLETNKWFTCFEEKKELIVFEKQKKKWIDRRKIKELKFLY